MTHEVTATASCGIVLEEVKGFACSLPSSETCSDCGTALCDLHSDGCEVCNQVFCDGCLYFHLKRPHAKPVERVSSAATRNALRNHVFAR